ncbi:MAG: hypothetical protein NVSMB25_05270 [Thermoleophilaceae bacterium]
MSERQPITFAYRNLVFGADSEDVWGLYWLMTSSYPGLAHGGKLDLLTQVAAFGYSVEADFQILRTSRPWPVGEYVEAAASGGDPRHRHPDRMRAHLERQEALLAERDVGVAEVYLAVRLAQPGRRFAWPQAAIGPGAVRNPTDLGRVARRLLGVGDPRGIGRRTLEGLLVREEQTYHKVADYLACRRSSTAELQWLIRRSFCRAVGDPSIDPSFRPQALVVDAPSAAGGMAYRPLEVDLLRLFEEPINVERRTLRIEAEAGDSYQAFLVLGALPETTRFPGRAAELMFAPIEAVPFPVDASLSATYIGNGEAVALARRRIVDADNVVREESHGDHGPSANSIERPQAARGLEQYLTAGGRPPLLRASLSLCVAARERDELERRIAELRRQYGSIQLHRPLGEQLRLFLSHLPAQAPRVRDYDDYLLVEQLGAMVPTATHAVGGRSGLYIGHTLSGSRRPVLLDLTEASRSSRPPAIVCAGAPGSGKTVAAQLFAYQAFLSGSRIVDLDPKDDHRLADVCGAEHVEKTVLTADERYRGMLDPLRVGAPETRADLAFNFLLETLPAPVVPGWQTELRLAVDSVVGRGGRSCGEVVEMLERGNRAARDAARAIAVHANAGLLRLGFAAPDRQPPDAGTAQLTSITIANLTVPDPRTSRADLSSEERTGLALLHLLAAYALALMGSDASRHKTLVFDEAWLLLGTPMGRALLQRINRLGRSQNATPIIATQMLSDVAELEGLFGCIFAFGVETEDEAARALRLLALDPDAADLRKRLTGFRRGRCLMRDYEGRVGAIQVEVADEELLAALDTRPPGAAPRPEDTAARRAAAAAAE